ncbi:unnamed protein product [Strongylus vulgaris]|uniref:Uncharacterized protein n=1 Tax=Strongylus vulgaris TaxID=40348 RepID=A0A3P7JY85_STRVU|nr:unnamed protein product [Strongylus vulgaris]
MKKEHRYWTWESPNDTTHAESDHILTISRLLDVSVPKAGKEDLPQCWRKKLVYDGVSLEELLTICGCPIEEDPTKDCDLLLRGRRACGESASMPQGTWNKANRDLLGGEEH